MCQGSRQMFVEQQISLFVNFTPCDELVRHFLANVKFCGTYSFTILGL